MTFMEAFRAASAEYKRSGTIIISEPVDFGNIDGEWRNRPQNAEELKRSQENVIGLWNAELDRHTPANGGRS